MTLLQRIKTFFGFKQHVTCECDLRLHQEYRLVLHHKQYIDPYQLVHRITQLDCESPDNFRGRAFELYVVLCKTVETLTSELNNQPAESMIYIKDLGSFPRNQIESIYINKLPECHLDTDGDV